MLLPTKRRALLDFRLQRFMGNLYAKLEATNQYITWPALAERATRVACRGHTLYHASRIYIFRCIVTYIYFVIIWAGIRLHASCVTQ